MRCAFLLVGLCLAFPAYAAGKQDTPKKTTSTLDTRAAEKANLRSSDAFSQNFLRAGAAISAPASSRSHSVNLMQGFSSLSNTFGVSTPAPKTSANPMMRGKEYRTMSGMGEQDIKNQEDMPEVYYQSCVRTKMNLGMTIAASINKCDDIMHTDHSSVLRPAAKAPEPHEKENAGSPARGANASVQGVQQEVLPPPSGSDDMSCDVSRDYRILLSERCLKNADASLYGRMGGRLAMSAPSGTMMQQMSADRPSGGVRCDYSIFSLRPGLGSVTKSYHESSLQSCIRRALDEGAFDTRISILTQVKGRMSEASCLKRTTGTTCHQVR